MKKITLENKRVKPAVDVFRELLSRHLNTGLKFHMALNMQKLLPANEALGAARDFSTIPGYKEYASELRGRFMELSKDGVIKPGNESAMRAAEIEVEGHHPDAVEKALDAKKDLDTLMGEHETFQIHELYLGLFPDEIDVDLSPIVDFISDKPAVTLGDPNEPTGG